MPTEPAYPKRPRYPVALAHLGGAPLALGVYFAILFGLDAAGLPALIASLIACPFGVASAWAWNHLLYRRHMRRFDEYLDAERERRAAERLAAFDAHVRTLNIFNNRPQG